MGFKYDLVSMAWVAVSMSVAPSQYVADYAFPRTAACGQCAADGEHGTVSYRPSAQFTQADIDAFRAERIQRGDDSFGRSVRPGRDIPTG
jgi:hypothetical protein